MRLLNCSTLHLETFVDSAVPPYAILSHRWQDGEALFEDIANGQASEKFGYKKLEEACLQASREGFAYVWIDTCCIDKSSSSELSEAINSMYRWYSQAAVCYAYLFDVPDGIDPEQDAVFAQSEWFCRGWTLQELVAPAHMEFFSQGWMFLGAKSTLTGVLSGATGIDVHVLTGTTHLSSVSVAKRMSWAAKRQTTRLEDQAYCLMGLFDVNMPMIYGEGSKAFIRLQEEIMRNTDDETLFAWKEKGASTNPRYPYGLLAKSPACFEDSGNFVPFRERLRPAFSMTNKGLQITLPLEHRRGNVYMGMLNCTPHSGRSGFIGIYLRKTNGVHDELKFEGAEQYVRIRAHELVGQVIAGPEIRSIYVRQNTGLWSPETSQASDILRLCQIPHLEQGYEKVTKIGVSKPELGNDVFFHCSYGQNLAAILVLERKTPMDHQKSPLPNRPGEGTKFAVLFGSSDQLPIAVDVCEWTVGLIKPFWSESAWSLREKIQLATAGFSTRAKFFNPQPPGRRMKLGDDYIQVDVHRVVDDCGTCYVADVSASFDPTEPAQTSPSHSAIDLVQGAPITHGATSVKSGCQDLPKSKGISRIWANIRHVSKR